MTPDDAFLQAILEAPDDDGPRLIYADWLEERGDPRGEFIRVQCELAAIDASDLRRQALQAREVELLLTHEDRWRGEFREWLPIPGCTFRRGFVESLATRMEPFLQHIARLGSYTLLHQLEFLDVDKLEEVMTCPFLERVTSLDFSRVQSLNFSAERMDDLALEVLLDGPHLKHLTSLNLSNTDVSDAGIYSAFLEYPRLARLKELYLQHTNIGEEIRAALRSVFGDRVHFTDERADPNASA